MRFLLLRDFGGFLLAVQLACLLRLTVDFGIFEIGVGVFVLGFLAYFLLAGEDLILRGVFGAEVDGGDLCFAAGGGDGGEFRLDQALKVGEGLLGVDEESEGLDIFAVGILVDGCEGDDELEKAGRGCKEFAWSR